MNQREHNFLTEMTKRISEITVTTTDNMKSQEVKSQFEIKKSETKLQYRQKLLDKLITDCITYRLTEKEAHKYIEQEYGRPISSKTYFTIKSKLESQSEETSLLWLNEFTRIGFVQLHKKLMDNLERIYEDNLNRFFIESRKEPRNEELILKLNANIRENTTLLSNLSMGSPIIAAVKAKLQRYESQSKIEYRNHISNNNGARARTYCKYCNDYFDTEVFEKHRCTSLPETLF